MRAFGLTEKSFGVAHLILMQANREESMHHSACSRQQVNEPLWPTQLGVWCVLSFVVHVHLCY